MSFQDVDDGAWPRRQHPSESPPLTAGIFKINTAVASFSRLVNSLGTPKDTLQLRDSLHEARLRIGKLVKETSAELREVSEADHRRAEISTAKKIADAKLAKDFHRVLKEFQKAQRIAAQRETAYAPSCLPPSSSYVAPHEQRSSSATITRQQQQQQQQTLVLEAKRDEVSLLDSEIVFNEAIIEEREQGIQEIQLQIGEINEIFKDLAVLVHDQGALIDDIGSNIANSHAATAQATTQLTKASKLQKTGSSLTCLLLLIFGIILLIVVIVVVA